MHDPFPDAPELLTPNDMLAILPVGRRLLYRELKSGHLPAARLGRRYFVTKAALIDFLNGKPFTP